MWVVPLKWSGLPPCCCEDSTCTLVGSSPWIKRPCAGRRERGDCWHSCHRVAPWNLGQKHIGLFCLMPMCLKLCTSRSTKEAKTSNTSFSYLLMAMSGTKSNSVWVSGKSKTAECPRRGFLGIYVPSTRRVIIKAWIFLLSWGTKKDCLNSLNSSCQAVKYIPFMPVSCCLFFLCLFL